MKMYERVYDDIHLEREDIELHRIYHELYPVQEKEISARLIGLDYNVCAGMDNLAVFEMNGHAESEMTRLFDSAAQDDEFVFILDFGFDTDDGRLTRQLLKLKFRIDMIKTEKLVRTIPVTRKWAYCHVLECPIGIMNDARGGEWLF